MNQKQQLTDKFIDSLPILLYQKIILRKLLKDKSNTINRRKSITAKYLLTEDGWINISERTN